MLVSDTSDGFVTDVAIVVSFRCCMVGRVGR